MSSPLSVLIMALQPFLESYTVFPLSTIIECKPLQPIKQLFGIEVTLLGITISLRPVQFPKAFLPMVDVLLGIVKDFSSLQYMNAVSPMLVTSSGIIIDDRPVHP